jgi:hypothetical protein
MIINLGIQFRFDLNGPVIYLIETSDALRQPRPYLVGYYNDKDSAIKECNRWMRECRSDKLFMPINELPSLYCNAWLSGTEYIAIQMINLLKS